MIKIRARFTHQPPQEVARISRLAIICERPQGVISMEMVPYANGLYLRLDEPVGDQLVVVPHASNAIKIFAAREDELP